MTTPAPCPCFAPATTMCAACSRRICGHHSAIGPFDNAGQVELRPVCMPRCDAIWWKRGVR